MISVKFYQFQYGCILYLDRLEHELPVVKGPQVFGDVKAN